MIFSPKFSLSNIHVRLTAKGLLRSLLLLSGCKSTVVFQAGLRSSMPHLSQTLRFLQSPSFRQAQPALIGQLTQCIVIGRTQQALVGNVTPLTIITSFIFQNKCKDSK
uniref:Uncharacterized protein n=1 Tax=Sinocyclocheilus anshuiensis TaxID=1608454 RepID=A0A671NKH1_9TELE